MSRSPFFVATNPTRERASVSRCPRSFALHFFIPWARARIFPYSFVYREKIASASPISVRESTMASVKYIDISFSKRLTADEPFKIFCQFQSEEDNFQR